MPKRGQLQVRVRVLTWIQRCTLKHLRQQRCCPASPDGVCLCRLSSLTQSRLESKSSSSPTTCPQSSRCSAPASGSGLMLFTGPSSPPACSTPCTCSCRPTARAACTWWTTSRWCWLAVPRMRKIMWRLRLWYWIQSTPHPAARNPTVELKVHPVKLASDCRT